MTPEERKQFLLVACALDRAELQLAWKKPADTFRAAARIFESPWADIALTALTPLLPRKFRLAGLLLRLWKKHASRH